MRGAAWCKPLASGQPWSLVWLRWTSPRAGTVEPDGSANALASRCPGRYGGRSHWGPVAQPIPRTWDTPRGSTAGPSSSNASRRDASTWSYGPGMGNTPTTILPANGLDARSPSGSSRHRGRAFTTCFGSVAPDKVVRRLTESRKRSVEWSNTCWLCRSTDPGQTTELGMMSPELFCPQPSDVMGKRPNRHESNSSDVLAKNSGEVRFIEAKGCQRTTPLSGPLSQLPSQHFLRSW